MPIDPSVVQESPLPFKWLAAAAQCNPIQTSPTQVRQIRHEDRSIHRFEETDDDDDARTGKEIDSTFKQLSSR